LEVTSFTVVETFSFSLTVNDCSVQVITPPTEQYKEFVKNQGVIDIYTNAELVGLFTLSDSRPECAI
jgi:hypothetical protein